MAFSFSAYHLLNKVHIYPTGCVMWSALISLDIAATAPLVPHIGIYLN